MLAFPHKEISTIVENAAMQMSHGRDKDGDPVVTAFKTTGFKVATGPKGEAVLIMEVGEGGRISFLLPGTMPEQFIAAMAGLGSGASGIH